MNNLKKIIITMTVIAITVIGVYNLNRHIPTLEEGDQAYTNYSYIYLFFTGVIVATISLCYITQYVNHLIISLLIFNSFMYFILACKSYLHLSHAHNYYDNTFIGIGVILSLAYLSKLYYKKGITLFILIANTIHMKCQRTKIKKGT